MGAINRGYKQYFVEYKSDKMLCNSYTHFAGRASTIKGAKNVIRNIRKQHGIDNPRDFKVYDSEADIDPATDHVPCVYEEA